MAKKTPQQDELARIEEPPPPTDPGFDFLDLVFGFPVAAILAHVFFGGVALAPVSLPVVIPAVALFVGQKALRSNPQSFWRAVDYTLALFPESDKEPRGLLAKPAAQLLESARQAVYERAEYEEVEEGDWTEEKTDPQPAGSTTPASAAAAAADTSQPTFPKLTLAQLARSSTILIVGSRGSGKSTLLNAALAARSEPVMVYDPHAAPGEWPMATVVHNSEDSISKGIVSAFKRYETRRTERREGIRLSGWPRFTLAADEWRAIIEDVNLPKELEKTPVEVSSKLMREGRKLDICMVIGAHGTTNAQLGCDGDNEGFLDSFDWIIYLGTQARAMYKKHAPDLWQHVPMAETPQGGTLPLIAICHSRTTGDIRFLDMQGFDRMLNTQSRPAAPIVPRKQASASADSGLLEGLLGAQHSDNSSSSADNELQSSSNEFQALQSGVADSSSVSETTVSPQEIALIFVQLQRGEKVSNIVKKLPGYNGRNYRECKAKVDYCKALFDTSQPIEGASTADDEDDPDIGPFGSMLGK